MFLSSVIDPSGEEGLAPLRKRCSNCTKCDLSKTRTNVVFGEGNCEQPDICFVGEAPGHNEDEQGAPFVGRSGEMLTKIIEAMRYRRDEVYVCNAVACRPPGNRPPEKHELASCNEFLLGQIRAVRPKVIVALGASAVASMTGSKKVIRDLRGKWLEWEGIPVMPTYHPSSLIKQQADGKEMKKFVWADMQMVLTKLGRKKTD